jgi:hypothetical protein
MRIVIVTIILAALSISWATTSVTESRTPIDQVPMYGGIDRNPYTNKNLNSIWRQASKKTEINCKLNNAVRHSAGCQLLDQGEDLDREL